MYPVDLKKAKAQLDNLIQIARGGEDVVIMENNEPILKLVRVQPESESTALHGKDIPHRRSGSARGLISMSDDFDEPLNDFGDYLQ
jgi:antitoxin (DNA-binding transcriptional repressor) of toxin-antitoxin stability system